MVAFDLSGDWDVKISQVAQLYSLFVLPIRTEDQGPFPGTWVILPGGWAVFSVTHCLFAYLIYSSDSLYISQPSSVNSHSLMINRAAALALPLTATCKLVTLNDSSMCVAVHRELMPWHTTTAQKNLDFQGLATRQRGRQPESVQMVFFLLTLSCGTLMKMI